MDAAVDASTSQFELNEEQRAIQEMAQAFAADRVAPHAPRLGPQESTSPPT